MVHVSVNDPLTWVLFWVAAIVALCGVIYLGRQNRKTWEDDEPWYAWEQQNLPDELTEAEEDEHWSR